MNKKYYNYFSVVIAILFLVIVVLVLYFVFHSIEIGNNNALTDPNTTPANPLVNIFQQVFNENCPEIPLF